MAAIRENRKNGKIISYRFTLCLERDAQGKQIRRYTTWTPPENLTPAKAKKAAERAADAWEDETRRAYQEEQKALACGAAYHLPPEKRHDDFCAFVNEIWFPLHICGNCKPTTNCFNTGTINASHAGGIAGSFTCYNTTYGQVSYCYNVGILQSTEENSGEIIGFGKLSSNANDVIAKISNCVYLDGNNPDANYHQGTGHSSDELQSAGAYNGFDFSSIWGWDNSPLPVRRALQEILRFPDAAH